MIIVFNFALRLLSIVFVMAKFIQWLWITMSVNLSSQDMLLQCEKSYGGGYNVLEHNDIRKSSKALGLRRIVVLLAVLSAWALPASSVSYSSSDPTSSSVRRSIVSSPDSSFVEDKHDTASFAVFYRSAVSDIEPGYKDNSATLKAATKGLRSIVYNGNLRIYKVYIIGAASPEGSKELNARLSRDRAEGVKTFLKDIEPRLTDSDFVVLSRGEDWEGAAKIAEAFDSESGEGMISGIFKDSRNAESKKMTMKRLKGGKVWRKLITDYYPSLRRTDIHVLYSTVKPIEPIDYQSPDIKLEIPYSMKLASKTVLPEIEFPEPEPPQEKFYSVAVKTNVLYDVVTALNAEVEIPIGKKFSLMFEDVFPWWHWGPNGNKYCFQIWSMGVEPRWWFARDDRRDYLTGHFAGVYGMSGKYDLQWDTKLCYQGEFWSAGLTYGYALPVCDWMNMEFSVSAGYLRTDYRHYQPGTDYEHLFRDKYNVGTTTWFGPTKLKVSLVIPIGKDSHKQRRAD